MTLETRNSIRASPTPSAGRRHQRVVDPGSATFSMTLVFVSGMSSRLTSSVVILADTLVDDAPAVGAVHGQVLPVMQVVRRRAGAHDGGQAQAPG